MYAEIKKQRIPDKALEEITGVIFGAGGEANISGDCHDEQERLAVSKILDSLKEGDTVDFDVEDRDLHTMRGLARINKLERNEESVGSFMRLKFYISLKKV